MIHVIGFGNPLCADDGVGVAVVRHLAAGALPATVRLFEGGIGGLATLGYFEGCRRAIVVDALRGGGAPGEVRRLAWRPDPRPAVSLHDVGVESLLAAVAAQPGAPEVVLVGVTVEHLRPAAEGLSPAVAAAVERAALEVRRAFELEEVPT